MGSSGVTSSCPALLSLPPPAAAVVVLGAGGAHWAPSKLGHGSLGSALCHMSRVKDHMAFLVVTGLVASSDGSSASPHNMHHQALLATKKGSEDLKPLSIDVDVCHVPVK